MSPSPSKIVRHIVLIIVIVMVRVEGARLFKFLMEDARPPDTLLLLLVELGGTLLAEGGVSERRLDVGGASQGIRSRTALLKTLIVIHILNYYNR
jgi:hypothetical protein